MHLKVSAQINFPTNVGVLIAHTVPLYSMGTP